jgi:hypothetical protein
MNEVEIRANDKHKWEAFPAKAGWPTLEGMLGKRALQEILELNANIDYKL